MPSRAGLLLIAAMAALAPAPALVAAADEAPTADKVPAANRPNIVMVVVDGLGDLATPLGGANEILPDPEIRARLTPNLDRLAKLGATFTNAQAVDTLEPPDVLSLGPNGESVALLLKAAGYTTGASGVSDFYAKDWDAFRPYSDDAEEPYTTRFYPKFKRPGGVLPSASWRPFIPINEKGDEDLSIEAWERLTESLDNQLAAAWTAEKITKTEPDKSPQFVYLGQPGPAIPFVPWDFPGVFLDRFPLDQIVVPTVDADDLKELPEGRTRMEVPSEFFTTEDWPSIYQAYFQAYFAATSATDYAIGKVIDAVEAANADDDKSNDWTLVVVSRRGYQLGQKGVWAYSPWEPSAHTNLMIYAPGVTAPDQRIDTPVSIYGLAPTLAALGGVDLNDSGAVKSLLPLLTTRGGWPGAVVLTTVGKEANSLRSHRFRLVRYADGSEELYDHDHDAEETYNLLDPSQSAKVKLFGMSETQVEAVRQWLSKRLDETLAQRAKPGSPSSTDNHLPGDFSNDGHVNAADYTVWRDNLGKEVPVGTSGDGDFDGRVEEDDRNIMVENHGRSNTTTPAQ